MDGFIGSVDFVDGSGMVDVGGSVAKRLPKVLIDIYIKGCGFLGWI